jgi:integrase
VLTTRLSGEVVSVGEVVAAVSGVSGLAVRKSGRFDQFLVSGRCGGRLPSLGGRALRQDRQYREKSGLSWCFILKNMLRADVLIRQRPAYRQRVRTVQGRFLTILTMLALLARFAGPGRGSFRTRPRTPRACSRTLSRCFPIRCCGIRGAWRAGGRSGRPLAQHRLAGDPDQAAETQQVLASIEQDRLRHAWHLALSGLRRAEIAGLRWDDVDFRAKTLTIKHTIVSVGGKAVEQDDGKSEKSGRTLPLTAPLLAELKAAKARQSAEKLAFGPAYQGGDHVVCDEAGRPYHPDTLTSKWTQAVKAVPDVPKIRLHDARHTCGTLMHLQGVPIAVISAWLGHADASFTMRTYVHSQPNALRDAALTLGRLVTICDKTQLDAQGQRRTRNASPQFRAENLAPPAGLEPATVRLTVGCSAN